MELLKKGKAWVVWGFADGSKRTIWTTLSADVMAAEGIAVKKGYVYDFAHHCYELMRDDVQDVEVFTEKPKFEKEVLQFASRFI